MRQFMITIHNSDELWSIVSLKDHKRAIDHHSQKGRYNKCRGSAQERDQSNRQEAEDHNKLMHNFRLASCADNFFNCFVAYVKGIGAVCGNVFFPLLHTEQFIQLFFKSFFAKPCVFIIRIIFHNQIHDRANRKSHCKVVKSNKECN